MRIKIQPRGGGCDIMILNRNRRDQRVYASQYCALPLHQMGKQLVADLVDTLRDEAVIEFTRQRTPQGYTVSREDS